MTKKNEEMDWEALELAIKIDNALNLEEKAKAKGNVGNAEKARRIVRELEEQAKKKGDR
jgi:hypothetical protein